MNTERPNRMLPPEVDEHLNRLLQLWADRHRLTPIRADSIRRTVVASSQELGYEWWQEWADNMIALLTRATTVPKGVLTGLRAMDHAMTQSVGGRETTQSTDPASYWPYLRLA